MNWRLVLHEAAFHYVVFVSSGERRRLLSAFDELKNDPNRRPDYQTKDPDGRTLSIWAAKPFLITYWLDAFVSEVRVVEIRKIHI